MLGWSINLFRVFGIQIAMHGTFPLLLLYAAYEGWVSDGLVGLEWRVLLTVGFFACVLLHELGHSLTAQRFGVTVPRILLLPIGGMAEMDRIPRRPFAEFLITILGPAVNFVIAAALLPFIWRFLFGGEVLYEYSLHGFLYQLFLANLVMAIFNFLPVYPMDGGRILRAILSVRLPYLRATWWALTVARVLAPLLAFVGVYFFNSWMMAVLFMFIFFAGSTEYQALLRREQEAAYWAEVARRIAAAPPPDEPPAPPRLAHGPN